ncbi:hypothetical protein SEA_THYATIRA_39 [Mycobacterium phage Thyatira]|uniref:DUF732 domain-containing protein n=1 Tax=Mycobacterium phage Thyatira TaxID=2283261 RepID=A0A345M967_9CAUD|nr:hypothetical protein I5G76_gp62 [Mycobacterium phage Thyatira]AXH67038.1 hypothetical protein SEA_THYATIRA_39 [Mycobacterium phage Thyatira]
MTITADDETQTLSAGWTLCSHVRRGMPREKIATTLIRHSSKLTIDQAQGTTFAAHRELCPDRAE